jgi:hypothetical protein
MLYGTKEFRRCRPMLLRHAATRLPLGASNHAAPSPAFRPGQSIKKTNNELATEKRLEEMVAYREGAAVTDHLFRSVPEQGRLAPPRRSCIR